MSPGADRPARILAAGGVLWRPAPGEAGGVEIALVHRPRYDDWSLPKGKLEPGEHPVVAGCREVAEETGIEAVCGRPLGRQEYVVTGKDGLPADKVVRYWAMTPRADFDSAAAFVPNDEVDELRWLPPKAAAELLTWERDGVLLERLLAAPTATTTVLVVRHAHAGNKKSWRSDDLLRPLDGLGRRQAEAVAAVGLCFGPQRVLSAEPTRCVETVQPMADALGTPVEVETAFGEIEGDPKRAVAQLRGLAGAGVAAAVCSQGGAIPDLLARLVAEDGVRVARPGGKVPSKKGSIWMLSFAGGRVLDAEYFADLV